MATDLCVEYSVGASLKLNQGGIGGTTTTIRTTAIRGLDGRPIQVTIVPNAGTTGSDRLTGQFRGRVIQVEGEIWVYNAGELLTPADAAKNGLATTYLTAVNTLVDAWVAGLEASLNSSFTLGWTPTGLGADSLTVFYGVEGGEFQSVPPPNFDAWTTVSFSLFAETG